MPSRRTLLAFAALAPLSACRERPSGAMVFAAASLEDALREIAAGHSADPVDLNFGSSGSLARQLLARAHADLFFSASPEHVELLERAGRVVPGSRRDLLTNRVVAIAKRSSPIRVAHPDDLASARYRHLVVGDPASVPAGAYAQRALSAIWPRLAPRLLTMPDVRAALAQAERRDDVVALVFRTDARRSPRVRMLCELGSATEPRIVYPLVEIAGSGAPAAGHAFASRLASAESRAIFERHGFGVLP